MIQNNFKFIDLFSGIGGFRVAMESFGGECVFSSEIDKNAILVYEKNFKEKPFGDITDPKTKDKIPNELNPTHKKFEWQAGDFHNSLFEGLIQFRPSGIRVKKSDKFSTFVAMNHQQIIGKLKRKIESNEAKKLLSFPDNFILHDNENITFKHLGNSVSVLVVKEIFKFLKGFL